MAFSKQTQAIGEGMRRHKFKRNEMSSFWNRQGSWNQFTAINKASQMGCLEIVEYILSFGDIDLTIAGGYSKYAPFTHAVESGNTKLLNFSIPLFSSKYSEFSDFEKVFQIAGILEIIERKDLKSLKVTYLLRGFPRFDYHFGVVPVTRSNPHLFPKNTGDRGNHTAT